MFRDRLKQYRLSLDIKKRDLANKLGISESYYNLIENGRRTPSKSILDKLVAYSCRPEEYWLYGVGKEEYENIRDDFKCIKKAVENVSELGLLTDVNSLFNGNYEKGTLEELFVVALKADLEYISKKHNHNKESR